MKKYCPEVDQKRTEDREGRERCILRAYVTFLPVSSGPPLRLVAFPSLQVPEIVDVLLFLLDEEIEFPDGGAVTVGEELVKCTVKVLLHVR